MEGPHPLGIPGNAPVQAAQGEASRRLPVSCMIHRVKLHTLCAYTDTEHLCHSLRRLCAVTGMVLRQVAYSVCDFDLPYTLRTTILHDTFNPSADAPRTKQRSGSLQACPRADKTLCPSGTGSLGAAAPAHRLPGGPAAKGSSCSEAAAAWEVLCWCPLCQPDQEAGPPVSEVHQLDQAMHLRMHSIVICRLCVPALPCLLHAGPHWEQAQHEPNTTSMHMGPSYTR